MADSWGVAPGYGIDRLRPNEKDVRCNEGVAPGYGVYGLRPISKKL
jgi:hypothetical protein